MIKNPVQYDKEGRMKYHPDYHPKQFDSWIYTDEQYLIERYAIDGPDAISFALGRTIGVIMTRAYQLRKKGKMPKAVAGTKKHPRGKRALET